MTNKIILVTIPDDVIELGRRISVVDLDGTQSNEVSEALKMLDLPDTIIVYKWNIGDSIDWLIDKIYKSDAVIFNASSQNQTLIGFLAGQKNSAYFNNLQSLNNVNKTALYDRDQCLTFLYQNLKYE
jgi:hypothetical protein